MNVTHGFINVMRRFGHWLCDRFDGHEWIQPNPTVPIYCRKCGRVFRSYSVGWASIDVKDETAPPEKSDAH